MSIATLKRLSSICDYRLLSQLTNNQTLGSICFEIGAPIRQRCHLAAAFSRLTLQGFAFGWFRTLCKSGNRTLVSVVVGFQIDHMMLIGEHMRSASEHWGVLGTRLLEPHHIPGVLPLFCYLMTFLQSGCVWLFQQRVSIWPQVCHFSRQE